MTTDSYQAVSFVTFHRSSLCGSSAAVHGQLVSLGVTVRLGSHRSTLSSLDDR